MARVGLRRPYRRVERVLSYWDQKSPSSRPSGPAYKVRDQNMALMAAPTTHATCSGVFLRMDPGFGLLAHSPYTGLTYAIDVSDADAVSQWLNNKSSEPPADHYQYTLGAGWAVSLEKSRQHIPQLLPNRDSWSTLPTLHQPILINWLITGRCPLACRYCYAEDLMRDETLEPKSVDIERIVESILSLNPLVVVVTGGDPLFSGHLAEAVHLLSGKVGIVVDTSGYTFTPKHLELFKQHRVSVRISLDSERPKVNQAQRPLHPQYRKLAKLGVPTAVAAMNTLCQCLDAGLCVTVQTVATKKNANDLVTLGDKLYRLGVKSWRIFKVAPSKKSYDGYIKLVGTVTDSGKKVAGKKARGPYEFAFRNVMDAFLYRWHRSMAIQIVPNEAPNAVILVGPDGTFYTESNTTVAKVILDDENPKRPKPDAILNKVDMQAHARRYLNLTYP
jgi:MoaA/NifB/PqqE/SkfB family radical SAM enzyme